MINSNGSLVNSSLDLSKKAKKVLFSVKACMYVVMYALFVLSVHVYYVNYNAKTQMGYLCALIK